MWHCFNSINCLQLKHSIRDVLSIVFLLLVTCGSPAALAKSLPDTLSFLNILENKDIAMGEGASIFQDSDGFMWLGGGSSLIRYDGYEFREIFITADDKSGAKIPINFARAIYEDSHHNLWVGTRAGLLRYDPKSEQLTQVKNDATQSIKLTSASIFRIAELPTGELIIASSAGLFVFDIATSTYTVITPDAQKQNWIHSAEVNAIYIENDDVFWLGTTAGLEKVNWKSKTFTLYKMNAAQPDSIPENGVIDVVSDREGKYWVATGNGLVHYDPQTRQATRYQNNPNDRFSIGGSDIWKLLLDSQGILWIASDGGGLSVFDKEKNHFINHKFEAGRMGSINSNAVRTVVEDRNGDIWAGNFPSGINFFDRSSAAIVSYSRDLANPNSLANNAINPVAEDSNGNLWLGIDGGGLDYFDRQKGTFTHFKMDPNDPTTLNGDSVLALCIDSEGLIWTGVWGGGIASYNPADKKFTRYPYDKQRNHSERVSTSTTLNNAHVWSIREDKNHEYWITTFAGGMSKFNPKTKHYTHYTHIDNDPESISSNFVWTTLEDSNGNLWAGASNGLNLMDKERAGAFTRFLPNPQDPGALKGSNVLTLFEDSKKRLWIGTDGGLSLRDAATGKFTTFTKANGFLNDTIRKIIEDADGILWIGTNNGFASFNPETKAIKNYNRVSGRLVGAISNNSGALSKSGEIIFGGTNGLRIINSAELSENKIAPPIAFTDFKIFSDSVVIGAQDGILQSSINHTDKIILDYKKSLFVFSFSALNFRDIGKNKYTYMLEGFDKNWMEASGQRSAKYTNLDAGTYTFKVKGSNNDGVWNEEGKSITIVQLPPPWKTWWAYTLYALAILAVVASFINSQRKKRRLIEAQNRLLEIKVLERTAELREKNNDIQAMLSNMRQGLFTIEASGNIHPEYSHFLEDIFETKNLAGQNALELLFGKADLGSNAFDQIKESMFAIIGEDEMNFEFNQHLLIEEYAADFNGSRKYLSLDWNPILVNDHVAKLMVSVRDVTLLKKMESEALSKKRELDIISQLLNVPAKKYLAFATSTKAFIAESRAQIECTAQRSDTVIALLFRNMHTVKGNCRTFNFNYFSDVVHDVESVYSALKADPETDWDRDQLLRDLVRVNDMLEEYERVYYTVLGRGDSSNGSRDQNGFWADSKVIDTIQGCIDTATALNDTKQLLPIQALLNRALSSPISEVLTDVVGSLTSIAIQLEKVAPQVVINDDQVRIKSSANELMTNIFAHILRNSVDHGIEKPNVREQAGKPVKGTIEIQPQVEQQTLFIHVKDDGQGVNIDRLFKKGVETGQWKAEDQPHYSDIANLIFASGVSTKEQVTNVSGRGVGMDAVKSFLLAQGGNITLRLLGENADANTIGQGVMVPFELVIELPSSTFTVMS